jgi:hypothetical protein
VSLAIAVTALMGVLFFFLFSWSARVERSTFFGHQFQDTVEQAELRRLSQPIDERWQRGLYHRELLDGWTQRAQDWLEEHPVPTRDENLEVLAGRARRMYELDQLEPRYALQPADFGNRRPGTTLPPGIGGLGADERLDDAARKDQEDFQRELSKHRRQMRDWIQAANRTLAGWRDAELEGARTEAKKQASRAISIDIPYLRGRGPEFVLSFTAIVVIIFSAVILGVLKVLHPDQIGTLLAAIAGYVLGRTTAPGAATRPDGGAERKPSPPSGGSGAGAQAQTAGG